MGLGFNNSKLRIEIIYHNGDQIRYMLTPSQYDLNYRIMILFYQFRDTTAGMVIFHHFDCTSYHLRSHRVLQHCAWVDSYMGSSEDRNSEINGAASMKIVVIVRLVSSQCDCKSLMMGSGAVFIRFYLHLSILIRV